MVIHRYGLLVLSYLVKKQFDRTKSSLPDKTKTIVFAFFAERTRTFDSAFWETSIVQVKNRFQPPIPLAIRMSTSAGIFQARRF